MGFGLGNIKSAIRQAQGTRYSPGSVQNVPVEGLAELERELNKLSEDIAKRELRRALRAGAKVIQEDAKRRARSLFGTKTGRLVKGIIVAGRIVRLGVRGAAVQFSVGLRTKPGRESAWYGRLLEFGTGAHYAKSRARAPAKRGRALIASGGGVKPQPFMEPAFKSKRRAALGKIISVLRKRIDKVKARRAVPRASRP